jgi:two-component system KDP operon response regulator KdpE
MPSERRRALETLVKCRYGRLRRFDGGQHDTTCKVIDVMSRARANGPRTAPLVFVVEDDARARRSLLAALATAGVRAVHAGSRGAFAEDPSVPAADLVLIDVAGVVADAVALTARLRQRTAAPILVLSPRVRDEQKIAMLGAGANDVIVKQVDAAALPSRMREWLRYLARDRRRLAARKPEPRIGVDRDRRALLIEGRDVHVTPLEYKLLVVLLTRRGAVVREEELIAALWGPQARRDPERLKMHVRQLRHKLEKDPGEPRHLLPAPGGGYRLRVS